MSLATRGLSLFQKWQYRRYDQFFDHPEKYQLKSLKNVLRNTDHCLIQKELSINKVSDWKSFRESCPITTYENYRKFCEQLYYEKNESGVLSKQKAQFFAVSSGTTSKSKFLPLNDLYRKEYMASFIPWVGQLREKVPQAFQGKALYLADVKELGVSPTNIPTGVMSGYNYQKIPGPIKKANYCEPDAAHQLVEDKQTEIVLWAFALQSQLTMIGSIMPIGISNFFEKIFNYQEQLLCYLKTGTPPFDLSQSKMAALSFEPNQLAYQRLRNILKRGRIESISELLPSLNTIICWKSSTAAIYLDKLKPLLSNNITVWEGIYSATEGWINFPHDPNILGGPLNVYGHFYEFLPIDREAKPENLLLAHELKSGEFYEIFLTTSMGFFRYRLKDKIKVNGFYKKTPVIQFIEKTGHYIDLATERVSAAQVQDMMSRVCSEMAGGEKNVRYYTLAPCRKQDLPHHALIIESELPESSFKKLPFEEVLRSINFDYNYAIRDKYVGPMQIKVLPPGLLQQKMDSRKEKGQSVAQFKFSPIENDLKFGEEVCPCC